MSARSNTVGPSAGALEVGDDRRHGATGPHVEAHALERGEDRRLGHGQLEAELGLGMDATPQLDRVGQRAFGLSRSSSMRRTPRGHCRAFVEAVGAVDPRMRAWFGPPTSPATADATTITGTRTMVPAPDLLQEFRPTDRLKADGRPTPAFRDELRRIPNLRNAHLGGVVLGADHRCRRGSRSGSTTRRLGASPSCSWGVPTRSSPR